MFRPVIRGAAFAIIFLVAGMSVSQARDLKSPLRVIKDAEMRHRDAEKEVSLGRVMTLNYPSGATKVDEQYHPLLLELTDVLKTPMRKDYRIILRGYSDDTGPADLNLKISFERAKELSRLLVQRYYMKPERINAKGHGMADPVASNKTDMGRDLNRRVEIHVFGDVSDAVRFAD